MWLRVYKWLLILALPSVFWASFELFLLTLSSPMMLFSGIAHASFFMLPLLASALFFLLLILLNIFILSYNKIKGKAIFPTVLVGLVILFQFFVIAVILTYDTWSISFMRVPMCVIGLIFLTFVSNKVFKFFSSEKATQS